TVQNSATANFSVEATNNNPAVGKNQLGAYTGIVHSF
ncbi:porin, partial [Ralstonia sp. Ralssp135]